jgi:hypothetical protein
VYEGGVLGLLGVEHHLLWASRLARGDKGVGGAEQPLPN